MRNLINIFFILCSMNASLFASASASSGNEDVIVHLKEHKGQVSSFFVGDSIAQVENYTLVPAYTEEHQNVYREWAKESSDEPFHSLGKDSISIFPTARQALFGSYGRFLIYLDTIPAAEIGLTSTVGLDWVTTQKNSYCLTLYVAKAHRGKGVGRATAFLVCQYIDKLRTIQGLENLALFADCNIDNTAVLAAFAKSPFSPFEVDDGTVYYSYPPKKEGFSKNILSIVNGFSSRESEERRKAHLLLKEERKKKFIAKEPSKLHLYINMVYDHLMEACKDKQAFESGQLDKAYEELSLPEDESVKLTALQEAFKKIKHIF